MFTTMWTSNTVLFSADNYLDPLLCARCVVRHVLCIYMAKETDRVMRHQEYWGVSIYLMILDQS
jgi:hypothetical protein